MSTILFGGAYWYQSTARLCPVPFEYRVGNIDDSFSITPSEARAFADSAVQVWEREVGRDLFRYDEAADFTIDFIFDERQEIADSEAAQRTFLDQQRDESEAVRETVARLQAEYQELSTTYESRVAAYEARLATHNQKVNQYNDRGGAPADVFDQLEEERRALEAAAAALEKTAAELNDFADEINELGVRGNTLVEQYNRSVEQYNAAFGFEREFTQGDYQGDAIHIYKFSSDAELETVLAHEFGHALGIDHVEGSSSVMYYLLEDTSSSPTLSAFDVAAYYGVCGLKETTPQKVRRVIRNLLAHF